MSIHQSLSGRTVIELRAIAKKLGLTGVSRLLKADLVQAIIAHSDEAAIQRELDLLAADERLHPEKVTEERLDAPALQQTAAIDSSAIETIETETVQDPEASQSWWEKNHDHVYAFITIPLALVSIWLGYIALEKIRKEPGLELTGTFSNPDSYKILLLPFNPMDNCVARDTKLEEAIITRLSEMREAQSLDIEVQFAEQENCPKDFEEGRNIGREAGADLVIWGDFYEACVNEHQACLKYALVNQAPVGVESSGKTQESFNLADIQEGKLQQDIDLVIFMTLGLSAYERKNYAQAIAYFSSIVDVENGALHFYMGYAFGATENLQKSIDHYTRSIEYGLQEPAVFSNRGAGYLKAGRSQHALADFQKGLAIARELAEKTPKNATLQRELSVSFGKIGDVQVAQGKLTEAFESYERGLEIAKKLSQQDAGNAEWQRDLSVSFGKIGDVQVAQGKLTEALENYQRGLEIRKKLSEQDAGNTQWQRDLSVSFNRIGKVQVAQGKLTGALENYKRGLEISKKLSQQDAGNAGWQRDLSVSLDRIGDVQVAQGKLTDALESYERCLEIAKKLSEQDAGNAEWQRNLSVSFNKIGNVQVALGKPTEALESYGRGLEIRKKLSEQDAGNAEWQRDLFVSFTKIGDVQVAQGKLTGALESYERGLEIAKKLSEQDVGNAEWQRDLSVSFNKIGDVQVAQGKLTEALESYERGLEIDKRLSGQDPVNAIWQRDLAVSYGKLFTAYRDQDPSKSLRYMMLCRDHLQATKDRGVPLDPSMENLLKLLNEAGLN